MSNWLDYDVEILASSPSEINQIAERLKLPSTALVNFVANESGQPVTEIMGKLKDLLEFKAAENPRYPEARVGTVRRFSLSFMGRSRGIVNSHLSEVSRENPAAVFLLEYSDTGDYAGKKIIRGGGVIRHAHDPFDWCPLDIFAPFKTEHSNGQPFGSLWGEWLDTLKIAVGQLSSESLSERNSGNGTEIH